jgi:hypothetical protein
MAALSVEDKAKGKRIITQFFRTMPGVQKSLLNLFDKDGYKGVFRVQSILYPDNSSDINSTDTLRKGLSMILQHIYGMPVEDKEGYFQDILKCKTANQVIRREKETLVNHFYTDFPTLKDYLKDVLMEDMDLRLMNALCQRFLGEEEEASDMRSFKNQIRNIREVFAEEISSGTTEDDLIGVIKEKKEEVEAQPVPETPPQAEEGPKSTEAATAASDDHSEEKKRVITTMLSDEKYKAIRDVLIKNVIIDPNFKTFQVYLDNILSPSSRLITNSMDTFSQGVQKIKEFRDNLEKELP